MSNTIIHKTSSVAGKVPETTDLSLGELATNTNDGLLFLKKDDGVEEIVTIGQLAHDFLPPETRIQFPRNKPLPNGWYNLADAEFGPLLSITNVTSDDMILRVKTDNAGVSTSSQMLLPGRTFRDYDFTIDWGDGTVEALDNTDFTAVSGIDGFLHTYSSAGTYTIRINGIYDELYFTGQGDEEKLVEFANWGDIPFHRLEFAFKGCVNCYFTFGDNPNVGPRDDAIDQLFNGCDLFNANVTGWDLSSTSGDMDYVFLGCSLFEGVGLETWDVSGVVSMRSMFAGADIMNRDISGWDVSSVTDFRDTFDNAKAFNIDISGWDVSSATTMEDMFFAASDFNQSLGDWDISSVTDMTEMLDFTDLSTDNYDDTLIGWAAQTVQPNVTLGATNLEYTSAATSARNTLTSAPNNWTINGDTLV